MSKDLHTRYNLSQKKAVYKILKRLLHTAQSYKIFALFANISSVICYFLFFCSLMRCIIVIASAVEEASLSKFIFTCESFL